MKRIVWATATVVLALASVGACISASEVADRDRNTGQTTPARSAQPSTAPAETFDPAKDVSEAVFRARVAGEKKGAAFSGSGDVNPWCETGHGYTEKAERTAFEVGCRRVARAK
ncbi:hypothetical protein OHA84_27035 [Streptomyces sp. NBC_00513]|uniref:hypothetical protein n=1 Tax=unclassified Streptomyces TaxID=2593676 RepID=UPI002253B4AE|nr:hypothetical protein [Streptomyces sp. NBC_00424]MCX5072831.1 hypothetical protein [Streptomyces sp. NBC_00424]WUD43866.1 hypothetical protein OHA84_27035 [Streptomyces sp. NBC_00513]